MGYYAQSMGRWRGRTLWKVGVRKASDEVWEKDSAIYLTMVLWIIDHVYLLLFLFDFIMASLSSCIFQSHFGACRLICYTNILSPSLSIQPVISSPYCLPLMYSHHHWLQGIFQSSKCPSAFSPCPLLQQWHWEGLTLAAVPTSPCLKADVPAHLLNASPAVLLKHGKIQTWEKCWVKHSIIREPKRFDFLQSPQHGHWECLASSCVCCFPICSLGVPGNVCNAWLCAEGRQGLLYSTWWGFGAAASGRCRAKEKGNLLSELEIPTLCCQTCLFTGVEKGSWREMNLNAFKLGWWAYGVVSFVFLFLLCSGALIPSHICLYLPCQKRRQQLAFFSSFGATLKALTLHWTLPKEQSWFSEKVQPDHKNRLNSSDLLLLNFLAAPWRTFAIFQQQKEID